MYKRQCIISCSQSDYLVNSAGTEKFIREVYDLIKTERSVVHIFPVNILHRNYIGINVEGKFYGVCETNDICNSLNSIAVKKGYIYCGVHLQHIAGWNKLVLSNIFDFFDLPIVLFIHDTYMICSKLNSSDGGLNRVCSYDITIPNKLLCAGCDFSEISINNYKQILNILDKNKNRIVRVVAPSELALNNWLKAFPNFREKARVRPHLLYTKDKIVPHHNSKIKIAYLGVHNKAKGYDVWERMVNRLSTKNYEFYCFSKRPSGQKNVKSIYTNYIDKTGKSVQELLQECEIDIVFLWSIVQETYSYAYYEASEAGCFVVTNNHSGNIAVQTVKNANGKVFQTENQCYEWLDNFEKIREELEGFWNHGTRISDVKPNMNIDDLVFCNNNEYIKQDTNIAKVKNIMSLVYYLKSRCKIVAIKVINSLCKLFCQKGNDNVFTKMLCL